METAALNLDNLNPIIFQGIFENNDSQIDFINFSDNLFETQNFDLFSKLIVDVAYKNDLEYLNTIAQY